MADVEIEPSVHMRLYSMNKRHFATLSLLFALQIGILIIIGFTGPPMSEECLNTSEVNKSDVNLQTGPFVLKTSSLSSFNQELWLSMQYSVHGADSSKFELSFTTSVSVRGFFEWGEEKAHDEAGTDRGAVLTCSSGVCDEIRILHLVHLVHPYFIIHIRTHGLESIQFKISNVNFKCVTYSTSFTQLQIWFKFFLLVLSFLVTCSFAYSLRKFSVHNWSMEQRWMTMLLPLLILYNNPIFALTFLISSWFPSFVDIFFQCAFLAGVLLFWLCAYHGVRQVKRKFAIFYFPKILLVGALWFSVVFFASWQRFKYLSDPTYPGDDLKFKVITGILLIAYLLYLLFLIIRAFAELRAMPYFDLRLKYLTTLIFVLVITCIIVGALRPIAMFGIGLFQAASPYPSSTMEFVLLIGMMNVQVVSMAFVYSPSSHAFYESHFKDNPALSMLNDSEDEVIYGEEISLTSPQAPKTKYDSE